MPTPALNIDSLTKTIAAVAPIDGVSVGRIDDRATWRIDFRPEATAEQRAVAKVTMAAWVNMPPVPPPVRTGWLNFVALFTPAEQASIALSVNPQVAVFRLIASGVGEVDLASPLASRGLDALIVAKCIAPGRKAEIIAGLAPADTIVVGAPV
jgi:hypothetical protein